MGKISPIQPKNIMKSYFALAALAGIAAASSNPQPLNKMLNNPQFLEFMSKQNKHYTTPMELNMRAQIYNDNGDKIAKLNAKSASSGMSNAATYEHNYWKIQNSWGTNWGDQGFVLFEIAEGAGVCGMNSY